MNTQSVTLPATPIRFIGSIAVFAIQSATLLPLPFPLKIPVVVPVEPSVNENLPFAKQLTIVPEFDASPAKALHIL